MKKPIKMIAGAATAGIALYLLSYLALRLAWSEPWTDGKVYMLFPQGPIWIYYLFRPLTYLDQAMTGMHFHIGPHR